MKSYLLNIVEVLCVTVLLLLFGVTTFVLVAVGGETYARLLDKRDDTSDLRVATSYLAMRVRQGDTAGAVRHMVSDIGDVLVLTREDENGLVLETRIYVYDGWLEESVNEPGEPLDPALGVEIAPARELSVSLDGAQLSLTLSGEAQQREVILSLRSEAGT